MLGEGTGKLGFGLMRLPKVDGDPARIDVAQVSEMVDLFLEAGLTYFDTAFVYDEGRSEEAARLALVERHPRESFTLATKLNARVAASEEDAKQQIFTSLKRLGTDYIDYYLLHAVQSGNIGKYREYGLFDYVRSLKEQGLVRHWGFSFHDTPELLEEILQENPDAEFVQLQINYADWEADNVRSRECLEVARRHGKPVVVMEPVKGGTLAVPPARIRELFDRANPEASYASWAVRFAASQEGILTVLSGMSSLEQMKDNLSYMAKFSPLSEEERRTVEEARKILRETPTIPCTGCAYCVDGCPMQIRIPKIFSAMNTQLLYEDLGRAKRQYAGAADGAGKAGDCIRCGQCEAACPQHIPVITRLAECAELFGA